ncbi:tRNA-dependent cyclodipeptide synthase [Candidatus Parcubacteria bacterium]|nr:tRNA-dependent cyclodipeptide synthase [Candidatus Parcubacteria bacterium]
MKLYKIRGGDEESLNAKKYNICVGISLGNKWFTPENIFNLIKWSLQNTKDYVVVCPADDIHAINLQVRNRRNKESALTLARKISYKLMESVKELVDANLNESEKSKIIYATWADVIDDSYKEKVKYLYKIFETDLDFKNAVQTLVRGYTSHEERKFSDEDISVLSTYILEELPEVTGRVLVKGCRYDAYVYPFDSEITRFVEDIQLGKIFPEVRENIMETEPKVFLEVR